MTHFFVSCCIAFGVLVLTQATIPAQQSPKKDMDKVRKLLAEIRSIDGGQGYDIHNSGVVVHTSAIQRVVDHGLDSIDILILAMKDDSIDFDSFVRCYSASDQILRQKDEKLSVLWYGGCDVKHIQGETRFFQGFQADDKSFRKAVAEDVARKVAILKGKK